MPLKQCQELLTVHLLPGACAQYLTDVCGHPRLDHSTCRDVACTFRSEGDLSRAAIDIVSCSTLSNPHLYMFAQAFGFNKIVAVNVHRSLTRFFRAKQDDLPIVLAPLSISRVIRSLSTFTKPQLISEASPHMIPHNGLTNSELRNSLMLHLNYGGCFTLGFTRAQQPTSRASSCMAVISELEACGTGTSLISSIDEYQIRFLSSNVKTIQWVPLCNLLKLRGISFSPEFTLWLYKS